jgi:hypothetical protein
MRLGAMPKSATDVVQDIVFSAVVDAVVALKAASKGVPNVLLRDLNAVHPNTTLEDLPADMRAAIAASVRDAFARLRKEGYTVAAADSVPPPPRPPRAGTPGRPPSGGPGRPSSGGPGRPGGSGRPPAGDAPRRGGPRPGGGKGKPPRPR